MSDESVMANAKAAKNFWKLHRLIVEKNYLLEQIFIMDENLLPFLHMNV
jgi:hypothetical protein